MGEDDLGYLYVTSDQFIDTSVGAAYAEVLRIAREMHDPNFDPFRVKLIKPDDPLAQSAIEILQRFPAKVPTRLRGRYFGGIVPEEVYIYPRPVAVP